jgi:single-strand DNA-binding protein
MDNNIKIPQQNSVIITGRLTRDPNVAHTQKGTAVCSFDIAVNRNYKDNSTNEWKQETTYVPIVVWGAMAEKCKDRLKKGSPVHVEGRLAMSQYTDKSGQKRNVLKVVSNRIQFLSGYVKEEEAGAEVEELAEKDEAGSNLNGIGDDEVPF